MRLVVTRPQADSERTAAALRARGHEVLVAPLMRVEPVEAELSGGWGAVIITSANAPGAIAGHAGVRGFVQAAGVRGRTAQRRGRAAGGIYRRRHRPAATCAI